MNISRSIAFATSALALAGAVNLAFAQQVDPANPNSSTASPPAGAPQAKPYTQSERAMRRDRRSMGDTSTGAQGQGMSNNGMPNSGNGTTRTDGTLSTNPSATNTAPGSTNGADVAPSGSNSRNSRNYSRDNSSGASLNDAGTERVARADRN